MVVGVPPPVGVRSGELINPPFANRSATEPTASKPAVATPTAVNSATSAAPPSIRPRMPREARLGPSLLASTPRISADAARLHPISAPATAAATRYRRARTAARSLHRGGVQCARKTVGDGGGEALDPAGATLGMVGVQLRDRQAGQARRGQ